ncbi:MAG: hypothetical protein ACLSAF_07645 [Intestinimonas sp.]
METVGRVGGARRGIQPPGGCARPAPDDEEKVDVVIHPLERNRRWTARPWRPPAARQT